MPVYRIRKTTDKTVPLAQVGGNAPDTAGVATVPVANSNASARSGVGGVFSACVDGSIVQDVIDGRWSTKTTTSGTPLGIFTVPVASSDYASGLIVFEIDASDGTDFQCVSGNVNYAIVNKAGSATSTITLTPTTPVKALSTGTCAPAFTITFSNGVATIKVDPVTSLTPTTQRITFMVVPFRGAVTLL